MGRPWGVLALTDSASKYGTKSQEPSCTTMSWAPWTTSVFPTHNRSVAAALSSTKETNGPAHRGFFARPISTPHRGPPPSSVFRAIKFARRDRLNPVRAESIDDLVPGSRHVVGLLQHTTVPHQLDLRTHELRAKSWGCWVDDGLDLIEDTRAGAIAGVPR